MPIQLSLNRSIGVRVHRLIGRNTIGEFLALAAFYGEHPDLAHFDLINLVDEDAEPDFTEEDLDQLRRIFVDLQVRVKPLLVRRSAWVCPNVRAWPLLESWLHERHSRDAMRIDVCLVAHLEDAHCLFDESELAAVRDGSGFENLASFGE